MIREDVLLYLKSKQYDVCCIQDTHFTPDIETEICRKWGGKCFFSYHTSSSRGVAILFKDTIPVKVNQSRIDNGGNLVVLDLTLYEYDITLASLYGPNTDNPTFYTDLQRIITEFENPHVVICGDWNLVQDQTLDTHNYVHVNNPRARQQVTNMKDELDLCDPWRIRYPVKKYYTWRQPNPFKQSRLDFFYISSELLSCESISYGSFIKKQNINREKELERNIEVLEQRLVTSNDKTALLKELSDKKSQLETYRLKVNDGIIMRSRIKWMELGERSSKYFLNLEKQNKVNKEIRQLSTENGDVISGQDGISNEIFKFYSNLYKAKDTEEVDIDTLLNYPDIPKLTPELSTLLEGPLSESEVCLMLKSMKNNKSPGQDGFTVEFFRFFWQYLKTFIIRSLNFAYFTGELSQSQKLGIITLIPKGNKPRHLLKNWRPISLLNVIYKIASGCIANRLKQVLPRLIHENQKGFLKGRFIGENIRLLYDILLYTELNDIPGMLLMIDFEKAFDCISHKFLINVLDFFHFGPSLKKWINLFYQNASSCVTVNGFCTERFTIGHPCVVKETHYLHTCFYLLAKY